MKDFVVTLADNQLKLHLLLKGTSLENIAKTLASIYPPDGVASAGSTSVADLLQRFGENHDMAMMTAGSSIWLLMGYTRVTFSFADRQVRVFNDRETFFIGSIAELLASTQTDPLVGKTVVFRYAGGSKAGNRVVKIERVDRKKGTVYYCGMDMAKKKHRCYDKRNIEGEILVIGEDGVTAA